MYRYRKLNVLPPKFETLLKRRDIDRSLRLHLLPNLLVEFSQRGLVKVLDDEIESTIKDLVNTIRQYDDVKQDVKSLVRQKGIKKIKQVIMTLIGKYCKSEDCEGLVYGICYEHPSFDRISKLKDLLKRIIKTYKLNSIVKCFNLIRSAICGEVEKKVKELASHSFPKAGYRHLIVQAFLVHDVDEARQFLAKKIPRKLFTEDDRIIVFTRNEIQLSEKFQFIDVIWLVLNYKKVHTTLIMFEIKTPPVSLDELEKQLKKQLKRYLEDIMSTSNRKELAKNVQIVLGRKLGKILSFECHRYEIVLILNVKQEDVERVKQKLSREILFEYGKEVGISILTFDEVWHYVVHRLNELKILPQYSTSKDQV